MVMQTAEDKGRMVEVSGTGGKPAKDPSPPQELMFSRLRQQKTDLGLKTQDLVHRATGEKITLPPLDDEFTVNRNAAYFEQQLLPLIKSKPELASEVKHLVQAIRFTEAASALYRWHCEPLAEQLLALAQKSTKPESRAVQTLAENEKAPSQAKERVGVAVKLLRDLAKEESAGNPSNAEKLDSLAKALESEMPKPHPLFGNLFATKPGKRSASSLPFMLSEDRGHMPKEQIRGLFSATNRLTLTTAAVVLERWGKTDLAIKLDSWVATLNAASEKFPDIAKAEKRDQKLLPSNETERIETVKNAAKLLRELGEFFHEEEQKLRETADKLEEAVKQAERRLRA